MGERCHFHLARVLLGGPRGPPSHFPGVVQMKAEDLRIESVRWSDRMFLKFFGSLRG